MAKQLPETPKAKGANSAARKQAPAANPRRQRLWRDLALIAIAPLLLYLLASLFTFSPTDPGWSKAGSLTAPIHNMGGQVGAWLADVLLYLFGYVAFLLPLVLLLLTSRGRAHTIKIHFDLHIHRCLVRISTVRRLHFKLV